MASSRSPCGSGSVAASPAGTFAFQGSMDRYAALEGQKRESPAAERNKQPILEVLLEYLNREPAKTDAARDGNGRRPLILEVASGSGQHAAHIAAALPQYDIQPSDITTELYGSIAAYAAGLTNVCLPPLQLDVSAADEWPRAVAAAAACAPEEGHQQQPPSAAAASASVSCVDAILCVNMCHISPLAATRGLLRGAGVALRPGGGGRGGGGGGLLFVYGPFTRDGGSHTTESNAAFDASLRSRNAEWGYRDLSDVAAWAAEADLEAVEVRDMPANNFMLVFRRR